MKKQVCSSLLALTMTLGTVTPALAAEAETNVQSAACTCTAACTEETRNMDCAVCGEEGASLTDCAQAIEVQDNANEESQATNAETGFEYAVNEDGKSVTLTGYTGPAKNIVIPSELDGKPVTVIGNRAFQEKTTITSVTIPEGVTSIGSYAFKDCTSLTEVKIPKGVTSIGAYAFLGCSSLTEVKIPEGVTSIGEAAFSGCSSLTEVKIPEGVTSIGNGAFGYCSSLTEVTIPKSVTSIGEWAFEGCSNLTKVIIPEGVTSIGGGAFRACRSLTEVTIPKSVTSIGDSAFHDCEALATVYYGGTQEDWDALKKNIGDNNTSLLNANIICAIQESNGFAYTVTGDEATITGYTGSARSLAIPSELGGKPVTAIADKAFEGYKNIVNIYIPKTIKAIGEDAFQNATSNLIRFICYEGTENEWANIAIQKGNEELNPREFDDVAWFRLYECNLSGDMVYQASDDAATLVRYFGADSKVDIPAELGGKPVTEIGEWAFAYYSSLTEVTIPEGVTSIRAFAFRSCSSLTKAIIPEGVTSIGESAFQSCGSLTEVTIPKSVTSIESFAFYDCGALATVYYGGTQEDWDALKKNIGEENTPLLNANIICKEKPKICKGGKEVKISNGAHEMRIHGKSYGTFTFAWVNDKAGCRFRMPTASTCPLTTASWFCVTRRMFGSMTRSSTRRRKKRQAPAGAGGVVRAPR